MKTIIKIKMGKEDTKVKYRKKYFKNRIDVIDAIISYFTRYIKTIKDES